MKQGSKRCRKKRPTMSVDSSRATSFIISIDDTTALIVIESGAKVFFQDFLPKAITTSTCR
jgi:hypothetical protein